MNTEETEPQPTHPPEPQADAQPRSEKPQKPKLGRAVVPSKKRGQEIVLASHELIEQEMRAESLALEDLHLAKAALLAVQANQKQEKMELQAAHAKQLAQAEARILELRSVYLETQRRGGIERRLQKREKQELAEFEKESRFSRKTALAAAQKRLSDISAALEKLEVLEADWEAAGDRTEPAEKRLEKFSSDYLPLYEDGRLDGETPCEFVARQRAWLARMKLAAKEDLAEAKAGPHVRGKLKSLPPVFQPKDGASVCPKARRKRMLFEGLASSSEKLASSSQP